LKRTSHITIVVETMTDKMLAIRAQSAEAKGGTKVVSRSARVAASRARAAKPDADDSQDSTDSTNESGEEN
jgi:hypothetical protein